MTLALFNELTERYNQEQERIDHRTALICSVLAEISRNPKKRAEPFRPEDFMPGKSREGTPRRIPVDNGQQMLSKIRMINKTLGGSVK